MRGESYKTTLYDTHPEVTFLIRMQIHGPGCSRRHGEGGMERIDCNGNENTEPRPYDTHTLNVVAVSIVHDDGSTRAACSEQHTLLAVT